MDPFTKCFVASINSLQPAYLGQITRCSNLDAAATGFRSAPGLLTRGEGEHSRLFPPSLLPSRPSFPILPALPHLGGAGGLCRPNWAETQPYAPMEKKSEGFGGAFVLGLGA